LNEASYAAPVVLRELRGITSGHPFGGSSRIGALAASPRSFHELRQSRRSHRAPPALHASLGPPSIGVVPWRQNRAALHLHGAATAHRNRVVLNRPCLDKSAAFASDQASEIIGAVRQTCRCPLHRKTH